MPSPYVFCDIAKFTDVNRTQGVCRVINIFFNFAKFYHCRICVIDFREGVPPNHKHSPNNPFWIGLSSYIAIPIFPEPLYQNSSPLLKTNLKPSMFIYSLFVVDNMQRKSCVQSIHSYIHKRMLINVNFQK